MFDFLTYTVDGVQIWVIALICVGVFLGSLMDAIAGGGGIITLPTHLLGLSGMAPYYALGTNKLSAGLGTIFSTARYIKSGYVQWNLFAPAAVLAVCGSVGGTWLQHRTPDVILKYMLLAVLPVVAFLTLRSKKWSDEIIEMDPRRRALIVWTAALFIGAYDGYYGPGTGTFLMLALIHGAKLDTRRSAGGTKVINLASNLGSLVTAMSAGYVLFGVGIPAALAAMAGHYLGAGLAIKNGTRVVRPVVIFVLLLLTVKVVSELLFPQFWG